MDLIEQAIFTSAETARGSGYQVVAASSGIAESDLCELTAWSPSHDALLEAGPGAVSVNFHPLPSGAYCISRTTPAGCEYSGRGVRVYSQCLIVSPRALRRFACNPFALLRAALASGAVQVYDRIPSQLEPLRLAGRAAAVDAALLRRLAANPGPDWMAAMVQAALDSVSIALVGGPPAEQLIAGLINCLPPECRKEFSFSTGLKFSPRRPFRVVALSGDPEEQRRVERLYNVAVLRLDGSPPVEFTPVDAWARCIYRALRSGRIPFLASELASLPADVTMQDLPILGLQLLEAFETSVMAGGGDAEAFCLESPPPEPPAEAISVAHGAHRRAQGDSSAPGPAASEPSAPSKFFHVSDPEALRILEHLDDLVYDAIAGDAGAMEQLKAQWPQMRARLGDPLLAESRTQYLRYALSIWEQVLGPDGNRQPSRALHALDVVCLLFDEV